MERLWSPAVATGGNRWQIERPRNGSNRRRPLLTVATSCRGPQNGKEGSTIRVRQRAPKYPQNGNFVVCSGTNEHLLCREGIDSRVARRPAQNRLDKPPVARTRVRGARSASLGTGFGDGLLTEAGRKCQSSERPEAQCSTRVGLQANKHLQSGTWVATGAARCQPTAARLAPAFLYAGTSHRVRAGRLPPDLPCADTVGADPLRSVATSTSCCQMSTKAGSSPGASSTRSRTSRACPTAIAR